MNKNYIKGLTLGLSMLVGLGVNAQSKSPINTVVDFEGIPMDTTFNELTGDTTISGITFSSDTSYASWNPKKYTWNDGFAFSTTKDDSTGTSSDAYSTYAGTTIGSKFAVGQAASSDATNITFMTNTAVDGFKVSNSTYAALSMKNGDQFAKQFGDTTGGKDGKDWFKLTIMGYSNGTSTASVDFYLADFRFDDNNKDYILKDWSWVDLRSLGMVDSIRFALSSSDVVPFGMNTPAYFCMDDFSLLNNTKISLENSSICEGDSAMILGNTYFKTAALFDTIVSDSIVAYNLTVNELPNAMFQIDTVLCKKATLPLVGMGTFSGVGVTDTTFDASQSGVNIGLNSIMHTVTDANKCTATYTGKIEVAICGGISEFDKSLVQIYPTVTTNEININVLESATYFVQVIDLNGRILLQENNTKIVNMASFQKGIYFINIVSEKGNYTQKVIKN